MRDLPTMYSWFRRPYSTVQWLAPNVFISSLGLDECIKWSKSPTEKNSWNKLMRILHTVHQISKTNLSYFFILMGHLVTEPYPEKSNMREKLYFVTKLFWPTVRKNCSSDREKLLKFEAENLQNFWDH